MGALLGVWLAAVAGAQDVAREPQPAAQAGAPSDAPAAAREVRPTRIATSATPDRVPLGQPFTYELVFTHPAEQRYELLKAGDLGAFELLEQQRGREGAGEEAVTTFRLKMALYELGPHPLPPLSFEVATPEGPARFVAEGPTVEGLSSLPPDAQAKGAQMRDLKPPEDVPIRSWRLLWGLAGVLAAVALGWALWRWWRRPRPAPVVPAAPLLPLDVRTRQALDALRAEGLPAQGRAKEFYSRLTDIVRGYVGERYHFDARESTTPELMAALYRMHTPGLPADELRTFLDEADLVKFAKMEVDASACHAALEFGYRLLSATYHQPVLPPAPSPAQAHASRSQLP